MKRRATTADRHYYYSVVEGTPFTLVVALQEKHFGYRVKIPDRFQSLNATSNYNHNKNFILFQNELF